MYQKNLIVNDQNFTITLEEDHSTGRPIIEMNYLREGFRQTLEKNELDLDLENLMPKKVGGAIFGESTIEADIMLTLRKVIEKHIQKYGRVLQSDMATYVAECILLIDQYYTKVLKKPFIEKKKTFHMMFNLFYNQLPEKLKA